MHMISISNYILSKCLNQMTHPSIYPLLGFLYAEHKVREQTIRNYPQSPPQVMDNFNPLFSYISVYS